MREPVNSKYNSKEKLFLKFEIPSLLVTYLNGIHNIVFNKNGLLFNRITIHDSRLKLTRIGNM